MIEFNIEAKQEAEAREKQRVKNKLHWEVDPFNALYNVTIDNIQAYNHTKYAVQGFLTIIDDYSTS